MPAGSPGTLQVDERRLAVLESKIGKLVDVLSNGSGDSPAIRRRLDQLESEQQTIRLGVESGRDIARSVLAMPDDGWIREHLSLLPDLLKDDPARMANLLRRMLGQVTVEAIVVPGKIRGFTRLHVRISPMDLLREALSEKLPECVVAAPNSVAIASPMEYRLDLGGRPASTSWPRKSPRPVSGACVGRRSAEPRA